MTVEESQQLDHGIYRIFWRDGGSSVASVGSAADGTRWFMPSNWISGPSTDWTLVESVKLIIVGVIDQTRDATARVNNQRRARRRARLST